MKRSFQPLFTEEDCRKILGARGYLVIGSFYACPVGFRIDRLFDLLSDQPFVVIARTTFDDHIQQQAMLGKLGDPEKYQWPFHYRVATD